MDSKKRKKTQCGGSARGVVSAYVMQQVLFI